MFKKNIKQIEGIYFSKITNASTKKVSNFYKSKPFPNYDENENKVSILDKGNKNYLSKNLKNLIKINSKIIEVGSGTCQLSNYFAIGTNMEVVAFDTTLESINLGKNFSNSNQINNIKFVNGDIFDDIFEDEYFDVVWTNGVLHHTANPKKAFETCVKWLKPGGYVVLGLYNYYGRLRTNFRQVMYKVLGKKIGDIYIKIFDPILRKKKRSKESINAWIQDQYEHPIESKHTFNEVFQWFDENKIQPICTIPSLKMYDYKNEIFEDFFNQIIKSEKKNFLDKFNEIMIQILMNFNKFGDDGGLFIVIGKKNANI